MLANYVDYSWYSATIAYATEKAYLLEFTVASGGRPKRKFWVPKALVAKVQDGHVAIHYSYTFKFIN